MTRQPPLVVSGASSGASKGVGQPQQVPDRAGADGRSDSLTRTTLERDYLEQVLREENGAIDRVADYRSAFAWTAVSRHRATHIRVPVHVANRG